MKSDELITKDDLMEFKREIFLKLDELVTPHQFPQLLRSRDVCQLLSISASTLQNLRLNGTIPYLKVGGSLFYHRDEVEAAIMQHAERFRK